MLIKWTKRLFLLVVFVLLGVLGTRVYDIQSQPALQRWHTFVPHEMRAKEMGNASWQDYIKAENRLFESVRANVTDKLSPDEQKAPISLRDGAFFFVRERRTYSPSLLLFLLPRC